MELRSFLPFQAAPAKRKPALTLQPTQASALAKVFKVNSLALGWQGNTQLAPRSRLGYEINPYDFRRILQAIDTDAFLKQGFSKYKELLWKEGWQLVGENQEAIDYIYTRFDFMELAMKRPIQDLMMEIGDQLVKFANAYVVKARGNIAPFFPSKLQAVGGQEQIVVGYYTLPAETVEIARDPNNTILSYRQVALGGGIYHSSSSGPYAGEMDFPSWDPEDVIHFAIDRKPGRVFGTPFVFPVMEDVIALRTVEEDVQNLVHRELFPLYKYTVGSDESPAQPEEITAAAAELTNLRTDGGLVLPERHDVEVIGAEGHVLEAQGYLNYFRQRLVLGLGLAEHHLGIMNEGGNRSVTDRLDIALYDRIKMFQRYIEDMIRLHVINELLLEGGYDPFIDPHNPGNSDRVLFKFREIDVDTLIKKDNQVLQKWTANAITLQEARTELSDEYDPTPDEAQLVSALTARMAPNSTVTLKSATGSTSVKQIDTTPPSAQGGGSDGSAAGGDKAKPSPGGRPNVPNAARREVGNKARPANQHTKLMSPHVRHNLPEDLLTEMVDLIDGDSYTVTNDS